MLSELHQMTIDLLKQDSLEKLLERIVELSAEFLEAEYGEIMFLENENLIVQAATQSSRHL